MFATLAIHIARNCCLGTAADGAQAAAAADAGADADAGAIGATRSPASMIGRSGHRFGMKKSLHLSM